MQNEFFHNKKIINKNDQLTKPANLEYVNNKKKVNINILLNRVRIEGHDELRKKIIFLGMVCIGLSTFTLLLF